MYIYDRQISDAQGRGETRPVVIRPSQRYVLSRDWYRDRESLFDPRLPPHVGFGEPAGRERTVSALTNDLTDLVFNSRNPKLKGKRPKKGTKAFKDWLTIRQTEIVTALREPLTKQKVCFKIFKARHPNAPALNTASKADQDKYGPILREIENKEVGPIWADRLARGSVQSRTIFVVSDLEFSRIPPRVRTALGAEMAECFAFVGAKDPSHPMTIIFTEPDRLPRAYNFSDSVVRIVDSGATQALNAAIRSQRSNAFDSIESLGIRVVRDDAMRFTTTPDRLGIGTFYKEVIRAGTRRLAVPQFGAYVELPEVIKEFKASVSGLPDDIGRWDIANKELFGKALGRTMAHEVRHTYIISHANNGLGTDSPQLVNNSTQERFSPEDQKDILRAIKAFEKLQGNATVVNTLSPDNIPF